MRRALPVVLATVGALVLLASFHTTSTAPTRSIAAPKSTRPAATAPPPQPGASTTAPPPQTGASTTTVPATAVSTDGPTVSNRFGDVQVRVTVKGNQLTDVEALQLPQDRERSAYISSIAGPELRREALRAQSARIDIISGASYTSESYRESLQAALDQAGFRG